MLVVEAKFCAGDPVGIGPVIAGRLDNKPVYYVDVVYIDGTTERLSWPKRGEGADRIAKTEAYRQRILLANKLRSKGVVLAHDTHSFEGLLTILARAHEPSHQAA